jgi:hypothetical protein
MIMGSVGCDALSLGLPVVNLGGGFLVAPFKQPNGAYGAAANTTKFNHYSIMQRQFRGRKVSDLLGDSRDIIVWPSSEHAFHGNKLLMFIWLNLHNPDTGMQQRVANARAAINDMCLMQDHKNEFVPSMYATVLAKRSLISSVVPKQLFDVACCADGYKGKGQLIDGELGTDYLMRNVLRLKLQQHPLFKQMIMACASQNILLAEVSAHDSNWGTGLNGDGDNKLGFMLFELGLEALGYDKQEIDRRVAEMRLRFLAIPHAHKMDAFLAQFTSWNASNAPVVGLVPNGCSILLANPGFSPVSRGFEAIVPLQRGEEVISLARRVILSRSAMLESDGGLPARISFGIDPATGGHSLQVTFGDPLFARYAVDRLGFGPDRISSGNPSVLVLLPAETHNLFAAHDLDITAMFAAPAHAAAAYPPAPPRP